MTPQEIAALIAAQLAVAGTPLTMSRGGTDTTYTVVVDHANAEVIAIYFDDNTAASLAHPVVVIYLDATCSGTNNPPKNLDSFSYAGRNFSCAIDAQPFYYGGASQIYVCLAD